ncbi:hypothetical protein EJ02DRAFT_400306 [Clathrospora elynae]|uniref:alpha-galactosidase n=1 Tax=Clathrospora elynae TaxID=706981 RepID=A0A6A5SW87_9PLEO|nr:hypothetical protein EJ02DRAFT_400306 [Clathrospora elynae]
MGQKPTPRRPWSIRRKLLLVIPITIVILALALGLGLGLTLGRGDGNDDADTPPTSTLSPLPSPNTTLPWVPKLNDTWQIILSHPPTIGDSDKTTTPNVTIFDIDLFDTPTETIQRLHNLGKKVICYFSAGSYEDWRPDAGQFKPEDLGHGLDGWQGEKWLKLSSENVRKIMKDRIGMAKEKGCDGVDPDNVDGYQNADNGLSLTQEDSISYISYLSSLTVPLNLTMGLKNAGDILSAVLPLVHFSVNEECVKYSECSIFQPFIAAGKPVFHIEYPDGAGDGESGQGLKQNIVSKFCAKDGDGEGSQGFSTVLKKMELDGWVEYCDSSVETTTVDDDVGNHD